VTTVQRIRIEALTDLVFGLALSIGALVLTLQEHAEPIDVLDSIFWFVFSFLILISVWLNYSYIVSVFTVETPRELLLNIALLLLISLEPFLLNVMVNDANVEAVLNLASAAYAVDIGAIMACLGLLLHTAARHREGRGDHEGAKGDRKLRNSRWFYSALFFLTALPMFWDLRLEGVQLRFLVWFASPIIWVANVAAGVRRRSR